MAKRHSTIPAFSSDIDRIRFGDWLSGFVDGEGCFRLAHSKHPRDPDVFRSGFAEFQINLRADDRAVLELIQSYLGCGRFTLGKVMHDRRRPNPRLMLCVSRASDLKDAITPHFERHPLYAKKSRDFTIWRQGVELLYRVARRPRLAKREVGCGAGRVASWTPQELDEFTGIVQALRDVHRYDAPVAPDLHESSPEPLGQALLRFGV